YDLAGTLGGQSVYLAPPLDGPDSLLYNPSTTEYTRLLIGGARVVFNSSGFHRRTINRLADTTDFVLDGNNRLSALWVPPLPKLGVWGGLNYSFQYNGQTGTLSLVNS